jgi:hypothetical protein
MRRSLFSLSILGFLVAMAPSHAQDASKAGKSSTVGSFDVTQLEIRLRALSPGDRSVIEAASSKPGNLMSTSPGSPNDLLWSDMEKVGWTKRTTLSGQPVETDPLANVLRVYALTEEGMKSVQAALARLRRQ